MNFEINVTAKAWTPSSSFNPVLTVENNFVILKQISCDVISYTVAATTIALTKNRKISKSPVAKYAYHCVSNSF